MANYTLQNNDFNNNNLIKLSYEYALANIFKFYTEYEGIGESIDFFNKYNNFSQVKLALYPYFITTSNGHSHSLHSLFGGFNSNHYGPASNNINEFIIKNSFSFFDTFSRMKIRENLNTYRTISELISHIKKENVCVNGVDYKFEDLKITNDKKEETFLYKGIDSGLNVLKTFSAGKFFHFNEEILLEKASKYKSFENGLKTANKIISYEDIALEKEDSLYYSVNY